MAVGSSNDFDLVVLGAGTGGYLEAYADPLPLVVEVWSRSTGDYDIEVKLQEYQRRSGGDWRTWSLSKSSALQIIGENQENLTRMIIKKPN